LALRASRDRTVGGTGGEVSEDAEPAPSDRAGLLASIVQTVKRRSIVVVVAGEQPLDEAEEKLLRRLQAQHDVLWVSIRDVDPVAPRRAVDARTRWAVPAPLRGDKRVLAELAERRGRHEGARAARLHRRAGSHVR